MIYLACQSSGPARSHLPLRDSLVADLRDLVAAYVHARPEIKVFWIARHISAWQLRAQAAPVVAAAMMRSFRQAMAEVDAAERGCDEQVLVDRCTAHARHHLDELRVGDLFG